MSNQEDFHLHILYVCLQQLSGSRGLSYVFRSYEVRTMGEWINGLHPQNLGR